MRLDPYDPARSFLGAIGSPQAADALRSYLTVDDPTILALVVGSLGWSGDGSDGPALIRLLEHKESSVRQAARVALAELEVTDAVGPLAVWLEDPDLERKERSRLIECLAWLRYPGILPLLRELLRSDGLTAQVGRNMLADVLVRVGDATDRAEMARQAVVKLEQSVANGFDERPLGPLAEWYTYERVMSRAASDELDATISTLSDDARRALARREYKSPSPEEAHAASHSLRRPRRSIESFVDVRPNAADAPPAKFFGQPDWRDRPTWPIGGDGAPLIFYGQLPVAEGRTAYLFTGGPDEWEPLGPGSALIVQPGGACHLPTVDLAEGPRCYDYVSDPGRFVRRSRKEPKRERYVVWSEGFDPETFPRGGASSDAHWNKVGGTPAWLQADSTPGPDWKFAFQFGAGFAGLERGDGAVFYGWIRDTGDGALGWDCH